VGLLEPVARQKPAAHWEHDAAPLVLKRPTGQGVVAFAPAGQKEPPTHGEPEVSPTLAQKLPAAQLFATALALPAAVQKPAVQLPLHADALAPPAENRPAAQALAMPLAWPSPHQ